MAKQILPVNFRDDVLASSMNGKRRYALVPQDDGTYILNDVTDYTTVGSTFGAAQINQTNQAVNDSVDKDDVLETKEEVDANTSSGKVAGAMAVKELSRDLQNSMLPVQKDKLTISGGTLNNSFVVQIGKVVIANAYFVPSSSNITISGLPINKMGNIYVSAIGNGQGIPSYVMDFIYDKTSITKSGISTGYGYILNIVYVTE